MKNRSRLVSRVQYFFLVSSFPPSCCAAALDASRLKRTERLDQPERPIQWERRLCLRSKSKSFIIKKWALSFSLPLFLMLFPLVRRLSTHAHILIYTQPNTLWIADPAQIDGRQFSDLKKERQHVAHGRKRGDQHWYKNCVCIYYEKKKKEEREREREDLWRRSPAGDESSFSNQYRMPHTLTRFLFPLYRINIKDIGWMVLRRSCSILSKG